MLDLLARYFRRYGLLLSATAALWLGLYAFEGLSSPYPRMVWLRASLPLAGMLGLFFTSKFHGPAGPWLLLGYGLIGLAGALFAGAGLVPIFVGLAYTSSCVWALKLPSFAPALRPWFVGGLLLITIAVTISQAAQSWAHCGFILCGTQRPAADFSVVAGTWLDVFSSIPYRPNASARIAAALALVLLGSTAQKRWPGLVGGALAAIVALSAQSRTTMVALAGAGVMVLWLQGRRWWIALAVYVLAVVSLTIAGYVDYVASTVDHGHAGNLNRAHVWAMAWAMAQDNLWVGVGFGASARGIYGDGMLFHALLQGGLAGSTLFLMAWLNLTWLACRLIVARVRGVKFDGLSASAIGLLAFFGVSGVTANSTSTFSFDLLLSLWATVLAWRAGQDLEVGLFSNLGAFRLLGCRISDVTLRQAAATALQRAGHICVANVNMLVLSQRDRTLAASMASSLLTVPDGAPLHRRGRVLGHSPGRVRGQDLVHEIASRAASDGFSIGLYGASPATVNGMAHALCRRHGVDVAFVESPPFRPLSEAEEEGVAQRILESGVRVLFVGLGCPKQEKWMLRNAARLQGLTLVGVGAAFDFIGGTTAPAPRAVQRVGLEWLWMLAANPRRTWRRVLLDGPEFYLRLMVERTWLGVAK